MVCRGLVALPNATGDDARSRGHPSRPPAICVEGISQLTGEMDSGLLPLLTQVSSPITRYSLLITLLIRHFVVVQAKVVPDLVDDGVSHLLDYFIRRAAEPEDRTTVDRNLRWQVAARIEERFGITRSA